VEQTRCQLSDVVIYCTSLSLYYPQCIAVYPKNTTWVKAWKRVLAAFQIHLNVSLQTYSSESSHCRSAWSIIVSVLKSLIGLWTFDNIAFNAGPESFRLMIWFCCALFYVLSSLNTFQYKSSPTGLLSIGM